MKITRFNLAEALSLVAQQVGFYCPNIPNKEQMAQIIANVRQVFADLPDTQDTPKPEVEQ